MSYNRCKDTHKFGINTYPRRIRHRSILGHIFREKSASCSPRNTVYCRCECVLFGIIFCFLFSILSVICVIWKVDSHYSGCFDIWYSFLIFYFLGKAVADESCVAGIYMQLGCVLQGDFNYSESCYQLL